MVSENGTRKPGVRGYLLITVEEASGRNKDDTFVWDHNSFEGFVKAELRGGERPVKAQTKKVWVQGTSLTWKENLKLEVLEGSNELRLMLCREKMLVKDNKKGVAVMAACGIYVNDILDAVPIDKYFELFKPTQGGDGGYIRVRLNFSQTDNFPEANYPSMDVSSNLNSNRTSVGPHTSAGEEVDLLRLPTVPEENKNDKKSGGGGGGFLQILSVFGIVIAGIIVGAGKLMNK
eukprot:TRINITY_DN4189_c1_g1_i3.p2 TRINITY_DN4189_c1_g1~~TRINITY_DN4189_c1_g1_i3.p2  ORF type:complete len:233 (-),score=38.47 TRINITY_DN4189_c1_g1_i3:218-916(-)